MNDQGPHFTAQQRAAMVRHRETPGVPALPAGSKLAKELAEPIERLRHVTATGKAARERRTDLEVQKRIAERGNVKQLAQAMRAGEDVPVGPSAAKAIEDELDQVAAHVDAASMALELAQGDIAKLVKAGAPAFLAELDTIEESQRQGLLEAIDRVEATWWTMSETRTAREWIQKGGKPTTAGNAQPMIRDIALATLLDEMRASFNKPRQVPRPTTDPDGTPRTGWSALEKLHSGERVIGTMGNRRPAQPDIAAPAKAGA